MVGEGGGREGRGQGIRRGGVGDIPRSPCPNPHSGTEGSGEREGRASGVRERWGGGKDSK